MYTFKLANGDIQMGYDGAVDEASGMDRIVQNLSCWLLEPLGTDKVYKRFGSVLWSEIGEPLSSEKVMEIRAEVKRVVDNFIAYERSQYTSAAKRGANYFARSWADAVIPTELIGIDVETVADTVTVMVELATTGGSVTLRQTL